MTDLVFAEDLVARRPAKGIRNDQDAQMAFDDLADFDFHLTFDANSLDQAR